MRSRDFIVHSQGNMVSAIWEYLYCTLPSEDMQQFKPNKIPKQGNVPPLTEEELAFGNYWEEKNKN